MKNTAKNRDDIASYVSGNWGTSMGDLHREFPNMTKQLVVWSSEYLKYDRQAREWRLLGDVYSASVYEGRMEKMVKKGF